MTVETSEVADVSATHPNVQRVAAVLRDAGIAGEVRVFDDPARSAAEAAALLGVDVGAIVKSLVFLLDGEPLLVLASGAHNVDTAKLGAELGGTLRRADADAVRAATGQAIGGVAPVGHPAQLRTVVDVDLASYDVVWAAAGHPHAVFPTSYDDLLRLTGGEALAVA